jgi:hypothetical protein
MKFFLRQTLAVLLAGALTGLPVLGTSPRGLVGVAQGAGTIQVNGQPFEGQGSLFSGDQILTGAASPLTVVSSATERLRFEALTSAQVTKRDQATVIHLNTGAVEFQTVGATSAELPNGISVRPAAATKTLAQISRLANGKSEVAVYKGTVEVSDATDSVTVHAEHTAVISPSAEAQTDQKNKKKKKLWAIFISAGVSAGAAAAIIASEQTRIESAIDP